MAKRKETTARAIQGNAGTRNKTARYIKRLSRGAFVLMANEVLKECDSFDSLDGVGGAGMARDWSLSRPRLGTTKRICERLAREVSRRFASLSVPQRKKIAELIERRSVDWLGAMEADLQHFVVWFAKTTAHDVTESLRNSLIGAGVSRTFLKEKWNIPVGRGHVGVTASAILPAVTQEAVSSVVGVAKAGFSKLVETLLNDDPAFDREGRLKELLGGNKAVIGDKTADLMALNMVNRVTQAISVANSYDIGVTHGRWVHVAGMYTSRDTHRRFDGKLFKLNEGLFDKDVGRNVTPADLINCRCTFKPVLPSEVKEYED